MRSKALTILLMASAIAVTGCKRSATGQVVAVVNGEEVSLSELNGELKNAPTGGDKEVIRAAALQSLINRKLLVQQARDRGIDKDPDYLQQQRRMDDEVMIGMLGQQVTKNVPVPTAADIDRYIASHPEMFANRTVYAIDQIVFPLPADTSGLKALEADHTLDAVATRLRGMSIPFQRAPGKLDTVATPPQFLAQVNALPAGEPFVVATGGKGVVSVITGKESQPIAGEQARRIAAEAIRKTAVSEIAQKQLKQARDAAKIEYQPGFAPKTDAGKPAAAGANKT
ncbi:EpsD family peptidyl-prolyl cis-trans isomerase [Sphingomonas mollis]|nr:EpsD family peptidyl-prolyl cis-trans isomerase [Sphingomonas sp. BT553]